MPRVNFRDGNDAAGIHRWRGRQAVASLNGVSDRAIVSRRVGVTISEPPNAMFPA